jgi:hypothetical protein
MTFNGFLTFAWNVTDVLDVSGNPLIGTLPAEILYAASQNAVFNFTNTELVDSLVCAEFFLQKDGVIVAIDCDKVGCVGDCCQCGRNRS